MNDLSRIVTGLRLTRPTIDFDQLVALVDPKPEFEAHCTVDDGGPDAWIYTIDGKMLDGEAMVIRAGLPNTAETLACEGLRDTIAALLYHKDNTGLHATVEVRGAHETH